MIDLAKLDTAAAADKGAEVGILHPATREPLGISITVAGADSDRYRTALREKQNRRFKSARKGAQLTAEELEAEGLELLARCTLAWSGVQLDGKTLDCTTDNAREVYRRFPWLREQIDEAMVDRSLFLPS